MLLSYVNLLVVVKIDQVRLKIWVFCVFCVFELLTALQACLPAILGVVRDTSAGKLKAGMLAAGAKSQVGVLTAGEPQAGIRPRPG